MNLSKTSKGALVISGVALLICFAMLIGTTWAWFTDEVTSAHNLIQAGTLKVDMLVYDVDDKDGKDANGDDWISLKDENPDRQVFNYDLWEPGYTQVETIKIVNNGTLALKYRLNVLATNPDVTTVDGVDYQLADVIDVYMLPGIVDANTTDWATMKANGKYVGTLTEMLSDVDGAAYGVLLPEGGDENELPAELRPLLPTNIDPQAGVNVVEATFALHMREEAGNEYQDLSCGDINLQLLATQVTYEDDSFDDQYDKDALYAVTETLDTKNETTYVGNVIPEGITVLGAQGAYSTADIGMTVDKTYGTVIIENSLFDNDTVIVVNESNNTFVLYNSEFILPEGGKIIVNNETDAIGQIMVSNIIVNGKLIETNAEFLAYVDGNVNFVEVWNN